MMARVTLTAKVALGDNNPDAYAVANAADLTMTAADTTDYNDAVAVENQLIIAHNTGASDRTINVSSSNDPMGRRKNAQYTIGAGKYAVLGPFKLLGWQQTDGKLWFAATHSEVKLAVVNLP
jgi:hypothetical protein